MRRSVPRGAPGRVEALVSMASMAFSIRAVQTWLSSDPIGANGWKLGVELEVERDACEAGVEHGEGVFEALGDVDLLDRSLVHVGVILDGADEVEDAAGRIEDGFCHALGAQGTGEGGYADGEDLWRGEGEEGFELRDGDGGFGEGWGKVPGIWDVAGGEPDAEDLLAIGLVEGGREAGASAGVLREMATGRGEPLLDVGRAGPAAD